MKKISSGASHTTTIAQKQKISANLKTENRPKRRTVTRVRREFARRTGRAGLVVRAGGTGEACSSTSIGSDKGCSVMGSSAVVVIPRTQEVLRVRPAEGKHLRWNQVGTSEHLHVLSGPPSENSARACATAPRARNRGATTHDHGSTCAIGSRASTPTIAPPRAIRAVLQAFPTTEG